MDYIITGDVSQKTIETNEFITVNRRYERHFIKRGQNSNMYISEIVTVSFELRLRLNIENNMIKNVYVYDGTLFDLRF